MKVVEKFGTGIPEPQWILDRTGSGLLHWRRHSEENNSRVRFRADVEVKEFQRFPYEFEEAEWCRCVDESNPFVMGLTCAFCIAVTLMLPWYIMGAN